MKNLLAQNSEIPVAPDGGFSGFGRFKSPKDSGVSDLASIISTAIGVMTIVAIIWFLFIFFSGAIAIIGSGGDKQALESAKKKITTGVIGLVVVLLAIIIINLVGKFLGITNILDIGTLFGLFTPKN